MTSYVLTEAQARYVARATDERLPFVNQRGTSFYDDLPARIAFRNDTGETVPAFGIVRVVGYVSAFERDVLTVGKPASTLGDFLVNGPRDVANGEVGQAQVTQVVKVLYDIGDTPTAGQSYGVDGFRARSFSSGKPLVQVIIHGIADATNKLALATVRPYSSIMIKAPANGIPGRVGTLLGSATCELVTRNTSNAQLAISTVTASVLNWAKTAVCKTGDRYGIASYIDGRWLIVAEDCNDTGSTANAASGSSTGGETTNPTTPESAFFISVAGTFGPVRFTQTGVGSGGI